MACSSRSSALRAGLCAALLALCGTSARAGEALAVVDEGGDEVELTLRDGETALVVHLWASWCPECAHELPLLARHAVRCAGVVQVAAVNVAESRETAQSFLTRTGPGLALFRDPKGRLWRRLARGLPANLIRTRESERVVTGPYSDAAWGRLFRDFGCPSE